MKRLTKLLRSDERLFKFNGIGGSRGINKEDNRDRLMRRRNAGSTGSGMYGLKRCRITRMIGEV